MSYKLVEADEYDFEIEAGDFHNIAMNEDEEKVYEDFKESHSHTHYGLLQS